ncbi:MAG: vacuolar iron transporter family protein [Acidobacteriota bacterium]|jgi:VIT1/CCC1 family predicted Fe2+/Mn2+ transporter|nr:vacuolar iron transporter family protein [Acidobacteriota bacterium]
MKGKNIRSGTTKERHRAAFPKLGAGGGIRRLMRAEGHRSGGQSGTFRAAVFGINDGLVSNLSLVMGVVGAGTDSRFVLLAGVAGLLAGAFSMAAGEYVSMRAQRDLFEHQISIERRELAEDPQGELRELELIYRSKGLPDDAAEQLASHMMSDPGVALDTHAREELGLDLNELGSPWGAALSSFVAFIVGAIVPVLPYVLLPGPNAFAMSLVLSGLALLGVGAMVSRFTGQSLWISAVRMLLIGSFAAGITYLVGRVVGVSAGL